MKYFIFALIAFLPAVSLAEGFVARCGQTQCTTYKVDVSVDKLRLFDRDNSGNRFRNAAGLQERSPQPGATLLFATNAGIFDRNYKPLGLFVTNGKEIVPLNSSEGSGNFYMQPNGVFYIAGQTARITSTSDYHPDEAPVLATQSGPLLLMAGSINPNFNKNSRNEKIRSGVGVKGSTTVYFVISNEPISFYDFAVYFKEQLGCADALYLDGYISRMYMPELGRDERDGDFAALFALYR